jgi:hypothetical protein
VKGLLKQRREKTPLKEKESEEESVQEGRTVSKGMATIHPGHENFNMVFNIMLGIKKAVDSTLDIPLL